MSIKNFTAALVLGVTCVAAPQVASAGGELQAYERTSYSRTSAYAPGAYAPPPAPYYARPAAAYYGGGYGYGCSPCATMPYGYGYGRPGLMGGSDIFTAGLLGLGIGYLLFH